MTATAATERVHQKMARMQRLYADNLKYFKKHANPIYQQINHSKEEPKLNLDPLSLTLKLTYRDKPLYQTSPIDYAVKEVNRFHEIVKNTNYAPPMHALMLRNLIKTRAFDRSAMAYQHALGAAGQKRYQPADIDVVVFGIGMGYHIEILCNTLKFTNVTIIENDVIFLKASMYTIRWWELLKNREKGASFTLQIKNNDQDNEHFNLHLKRHCHRLFPAISVSTLIYNHEPVKADYTEAKKVVEEYAKHMKMASEMIAPDAQRLFNATENIKKGYPAIDLDKSILKDKYIAVVGAGPSLDIYIDSIKKYRERFFLISAGTGLSSLLGFGIKPDLHFELEFQNLAYKILKKVNEEFSLSDLDLVGTYEVNPFFPPLFNNVYMFIPESSELQPLFGEKHTLRRGGMTCTNGATAFASRLTEQDIYLIGLDFAYTNGEHHNKTNISQKPKDDFRIIDDQFGTATNFYVPDTQGSEVKTSIRLNSARLTMESLLPCITNQVYNCSKGAHISRSRYLSVEALEQKIASAPSNPLTFSLTCCEINPIKAAQRTEKILNTSIKNAHDMLEKLGALTDNPYQNSRVVKNLFQEIERHNIEDLGQLRNTLSIVKYPLLQLFIIVNMLPANQQKPVIDVWKSDYTSYVQYLQHLFSFAIDNNEFLIEEDWVGVNANKTKKKEH